MKACKIIALSTLAKKEKSSAIIEAAEKLHFSLLRSFRLNISNEATCASVESLITAALLGLYDVSSDLLGQSTTLNITR